MSEQARDRDRQARLRAQREYERPLVVQAGAGTGKTAVLTARLVVWALGRGWHQMAEQRAVDGADTAPDAIARAVLGRITAITFTEAAAAEMARRVEEALGGIVAGEPEAWLDLPEELAADAARERARALRESLDHLTVRTIHAWCRSLLARFPIAAGLHPDFEVDATGRVQGETLQRVLEAQLRDDYTAGGPLLELAAQGSGPTDVYDALGRLIDAGVRSHELEAEPLGGTRLVEALGRLGETFAELAGLLGQAAKLSAKPAELLPMLRATIESVDALLPGPPDTDRVEAFCNELRERFGDRAKVLGEWSRKKSTAKLCKSIGIEEDEFAACAGRAERPFALLHGLSPRRLQAANDAFRALLAEFEQQIAARGVVTYSDLLRGARDLVVGHPTIARALRADLGLLLVDEFQDTDALQCDLVRVLALEGPAESRPSLFVVGDPKQSIYGWRSADLVAYEAFVSAIEQAGGERLVLSVNFRSVPAVLEEVERVIAPVMEEVPGVQPSFEALVPSEKNASAGGFASGDHAAVEHWVSWAPEDTAGGGASTRAGEATAIEARAFAADVARLRDEHAVDLSNVALLMRGRGDLDLYLRALREREIPYVVTGERSYYSRREIVEAIAALRCVLDPHDHLSLLAWIRSATVGVPDAALIGLWAEGFADRAGRLHADRPEELDALAGVVRGVAAALPDDVPGLDRLGAWQDSLVAALGSIARLRASFERDAPDRFVERLRSELALELTEAGRFPAVFRVANLERFYRDLAAELAAGADPSALLRRLKSAAERERDVDEPVVAVAGAVQVMTIHGAKGLGFDHVYLAQVHKGRGHGRKDRVLRRDGAVEYRLLEVATLGVIAAEDEEAEREEAERIRLLYVALTRAKQRLVVMGARESRAESLGAIVGRRRDHPDLDSCFARASEEGELRVDVGGARWWFPGLDVVPPATRDGSSEAEARVIRPGTLPIGPAQWVAERRAVRAHMDRPRTAPASQLGHAARREHVAAAGFESVGEHSAALAGTDAIADAVADALAIGHAGMASAANGAGGADARAVGTAVHAALEDWDLAAEPGAELERQRERLAGVLQALGAQEPEASCAEALAVLEAFASGPLLDRFVALGDRVVARELPVVLPAASAPGRGAASSTGEDHEHAGPIDGVVGAIDLVYRDDSGLVVVDYKTDRVESAEARAERALRYAPQGQAYVEALASGLGLDAVPRFELWFLRDGEIETPLG